MLRATAQTKQTPSKRSSIRARLTALVLGSVLFSVLPVCTLFATNEAVRHGESRWSNIRTAADILASSVSEAAAARDSQRAFGAIRAISRSPGIVYAKVQLLDGVILAENGSGARLRNDVRLNADNPNPDMVALITTKTVEAEAPIMMGTRKVGRVVVVHTAQNFVGGLLKSLGGVLGLALLSLMVSLAISRRIQRAMTAPLGALTQAVAVIGKEGDYSRRVDVTSQDEVGTLVEGFNAMLSAISQRDQKIATQMQGLEGEVAARTRDYVVARDAAETANAAKSDFLATMSHEIRTPMNGVMVMAELLASENLPPKANRHAQTIVKSGRNLLAVINDILDFSKIEAGMLTVEICEVDVLELIDDTLALFHAKAAEKGLELVASAHPHAPRFVPADPVRLGQVITNLVSNALKFTENGYVAIHLEPDSDPSFWRLIVQDTGIGIACEKVSGIFAAFSQEDQTTTRRFGGTGLGLSISKRLVEAMGGQIAVTSKQGAGTRLHVRLPATLETTTAAPPDLGHLPETPRAALMMEAPRERAAIARRLALACINTNITDPKLADLVICDRTNRSQLAGLVDPQKLILLADGDDHQADEWVQTRKAVGILQRPVRHRDLDRLITCLGNNTSFAETAATIPQMQARLAYPDARVLVVDDSEVNREVALEALSEFGIKADIAKDGFEAVSATAQKTYDLVLMDGSMPGMDGYEATRHIRARDLDANKPVLPILALTAHVVGTAAKAWQEAGMDGVLHKPFTLADLGRLLEAHLPAILAREPAPTLPETMQPENAAVAAEPASTISAGLFDMAVMGPLLEGRKTGKADFVNRVFGLYQRHAPEALLELKIALDQADQERIAKAAHALKSMSLNLGASAVSKTANIIEAAIRIEHRTIAAHEYNAVDQALTQTLIALFESDGATGTIAEPAVQAPTSPTVTVKAPQTASVSNQLTPEEQTIVDELAAAIEGGQLTMAYQPLFDRTGQKLVSAEALVRWRRINGGPIGPDVFIPLAEKAGLIHALGASVRQKVFYESANWTQIKVAVNVSAIELGKAGFCEDLSDLVAKTGFDPKRLTLEVTETAFLGDPDRVRAIFAKLRATGIRLALDDFGVGYSSLTSLHRFPFDTIKIDREFVNALDGDAVSAREALAIIQAVSGIGRALGREVVAEGVETTNQHMSLKAAGVHTLQGYLFGKPMPQADFSEIYARAFAQNANAA